MGSKSRCIRWLGTTMAAALIIAACSGGTTGGATSTPSVATSAPAAAATTAAPDPNVLPKPELTKIRLGLSAPTEPVQFAEKLADLLGFYQKYGLTAEITGFEGDGKALQAMVAGQLDMYVGGGSTAVSTILTDTPTKVVAMNSVTNDDGLFCTKDIKAAADVKGKSVAISTFGGTSHGSALLLLKALGLTSKDATITQVGGEGTRIAAVKAGSVGCAVVGVSETATLKALGINLLADLTTTKLQWGRSGLMATNDFIAKNPNTVLAVVAATLLAQNSMYTDTKGATDKFATFAQVKPADATVAMTAFIGYGTRSMMFTAEALINPRDVLATVNPAVANLDVTKAMDLSFLNKLKDSGFYAKNGIPLN